MQKAENALSTGANLAFDYMKLGGGRRSIERRHVVPLSLRLAQDGRLILTAEDLGRQARPRSYRLERMFHVKLED